jgi:rhodanese-related sulfurtransferase
MEFIEQNLLLVALVVISGGMLLASFRPNPNELTPADATMLINREDALVVDIRAPAEFADGHIVEARNIPGDKLDERAGELEKFKDRPIILSCQTGARSTNACGRLRKHGFARVYNLAGGLGAWQQAGLPLKRGAK